MVVRSGWLDTHCNACSPSPSPTLMETGASGLTVVAPMRTSWRVVFTCKVACGCVSVGMDVDVSVGCQCECGCEVGRGWVMRGCGYQKRTLLIWVGCTSAEGMEKSQYLENVF